VVRTCDEVRHRPIALVREIVGNSDRRTPAEENKWIDKAREPVDVIAEMLSVI